MEIEPMWWHNPVSRAAAAAIYPRATEAAAAAPSLRGLKVS
jgi:hypothetical protein